MTASIQFPLPQSNAESAFEKWQANNDAHLNATIDWVMHSLNSNSAARRSEERNSTEPSSDWPKNDDVVPSLVESIVELNARYRGDGEHDAPSAINVLVEQFGLNTSDQAVLALLLAASLEPAVAERCMTLSGSVTQRNPTATLAVSLLDDADWSSFPPHAPLRYWLLIEWQPAEAGNAFLILDERVMNFVRGLNYVDERLSVLLEPIGGALPSPLMPSQCVQLETMLTFLEQNRTYRSNTGPTVVELFGDDVTAKLSMAHAVATQLGVNLQRLNVSSLPTNAIDVDALARLWLRDAGLLPMLLFIEGADDPSFHRSLVQFVGRLGGLVLINAGHSPISLVPRSLPLEVKRPTVKEQESLWLQTLNETDETLPARLAEQFSMSEQEIHRSASVAFAESNNGDAHAFERALWRVCQRGASSGLSKLAQRIECKARWDTLILPEAQTRMLKQLSAQVALRSCVYQQWGFRDKMSRGMGISAMFSGESGTGKTMAAEVLANALNLDLYRIDLASVISKYIGETEKQMRSLFQAAERCGAILFFDEADALFGKRGETKNSNDRFSNIGIDDLLQRIEMYNGLAILATNLKSGVDKAFLRRLRFVVDFPFPGPTERERIWRSVFPPQTPMADDFNPARLARLNLTGGNIHNVALNGAFLSAQHNEPVSMRWLMEAAAGELQKLERPIKAGDLDYG
ncbi:ATP-binding protein [Enterovibrio sp. ZSDZ35]|uniref:ATP-binding protein n=1 Tax=Enterovibrio qingdaonensis TaxID=2899818 RepID=A0ABT5QHY7_9GAMM|nr:ATP-binding protein [Enterovibrio sp. ZSDZ35]MDD1780469.1 ATP-binding protein [Enterovibrio sp. ZSDZ35]